MNKTRRVILKGALLAPLLPLSRLAGAAPTSERKLSFYHTHTGEKLSVVYHDGRDYLRNHWQISTGICGILEPAI